MERRILPVSRALHLDLVRTCARLLEALELVVETALAGIVVGFNGLDSRVSGGEAWLKSR